MSRRYKPALFDIVTTKVVKDAYYADEAWNKGAQFKPGMVGTVARVDVPTVRERSLLPARAGETWAPTFSCVDWVDEQGRVQRCALYAVEMVKVD